MKLVYIFCLVICLIHPTKPSSSATFTTSSLRTQSLPPTEKQTITTASSRTSPRQRITISRNWDHLEHWKYLPTTSHNNKSSIPHEVIFVLKQKNLETLDDILHDITSNHIHPNYGKHWDWSELHAYTRNEEAEIALKAYLKTLTGLQITKESIFGDFITVKGALSLWEEVFATKFHHIEIEHPQSQKRRSLYRAKAYSLPIELQDHITTVFNVIQFPTPVFSHIQYHEKSQVPEETKTEATGSNSIPIAATTGYVTPGFLKSLYNISIPNNNHMMFEGNPYINQSIYGALNETVSPSDLTAFQHAFHLPIQGIQGKVNGHVNSAICNTHPNQCYEANLDIQYLTSMAPNTSSTYYYYDPIGDWIHWITSVANMRYPYQVMSISYSSYESYMDTDVLDVFNLQAKKLGIIGTTIVVSSGDDGVAGWLARNNNQNCQYSPQFPASSPYVTTVGGTMGPESGYAEVVCQANGLNIQALITSGGGFSNYFALPTWQSSNVIGYLNLVKGSQYAPMAGYTATGRAYPDIALLAHSYKIYVGGRLAIVDGTSASTPVFAGMISFLNTERRRKGMPLVGWLTPSLYQYAPSFVKDITIGNNKCTALETMCCHEGFYAAPGWDPVTGLGSIDFQAFLHTYLSMDFTVTISPSSVPTAFYSNAAATVSISGMNNNLSFIWLMSPCLLMVLLLIF